MIAVFHFFFYFSRSILTWSMCFTKCACKTNTRYIKTAEFEKLCAIMINIKKLWVIFLINMSQKLGCSIWFLGIFRVFIFLYFCYRQTGFPYKIFEYWDSWKNFYDIIFPWILNFCVSLAGNAVLIWGFPVLLILVFSSIF